MPRVSVWARVALVLGVGGCTPSPLVRVAEQGNFESLHQSLAERVANGTLHDGEAKDVAFALAKGEVERSQGDAGEKRIEELRRCAREVDGPLAARADKRDALGATAGLLLVDEDVTSPSRYSRWANRPADDPEAAMRPLGVRTLTWKSDGDLRRKLMLDPYAEVRRSALHASAEASDDEDVEPVLEAARVDPHAASRKEAILTAGALGGERVVTALADLWPRGDAETHEAIVNAWAMDRSLSHGGRDRLVWVLETQHGGPALLAGKKLAQDKDAAVASEAIATLERAIDEGPTADRVRAIEEAPDGIEPVRLALEKAESAQDEVVAAAAMKRHLRTLKDRGAREALIAKLLVLARGAGTGVPMAREALALARVPDVVPLLEEDAAKGDAAARARAGATLALYGDYPRAVVVAADREPQVRTKVACEILRASNRGPGQ